MTTVSDANTWWTAPAGGTPTTGFAAQTDFVDWFHIGSLAAGLPARVSVLPDYFIPYASGAAVGGLLPEAIIAASNIRLYQLVTITGNFDAGVIGEGLYAHSIGTTHNNQLLVPVGSAIELVDQILTAQYPAGLLPYVFYQVTATVPSGHTVTHVDAQHPSNSYTVTWESDFYLEVAIGGTFPQAPVATAGRYLVTTGNPTGQRSTAWGSWLDGWDLVTLQPVGASADPTDADLDPQNLPPTLDFYATADQHGVETPPIDSALDAAWWRANGETVLLGYSSMALDALKGLANASGFPHLGASIDVINASAGAAGVWSFLDGLVARIWAHAAEGISLATLAGASPNPSAYASQIADWEARGRQIAQEAEQQSQDQALSIVLDKPVPGAGTVWSVFRSIPYAAHEKNSFSLALHVPGLEVEGSGESNVLYGGDGGDEMLLGGGTDLALGFGGNDVIAAGDGNDWLQGGAGNDTLDGGAGLDTAFFSGARAAYTIGSGGASAAGPDGSDVLAGIERLRFSDMGLAFDLGAGQAAGNTVRVIGAAFDAPTIAQHPDYVGIGLALFDSGMSVLAVCQLVIGVMGSPDNTSFVSTVYQNLVGAPPSQAELDFYVGLLAGSGGVMTQAQLLEIAVNSDINAQNIDLAGLQQTGVEFV